MEPSAALSDGQEQAISELRAIGSASGADLVFDAGYRRADEGWLQVRVWLAGDQFPDPANDVRLDEWEPVLIDIPASFPVEQPWAGAGHFRFAGQPHVMWGNQLCLYTSSSEWEPAPGMAGFLRRLQSFYERLVLGKFEGPEVPWHPPVAYSAWQAGCVVMNADLPPQDRARPEAFLRWAVGIRRGPERADVVEWLGFAGLPGPGGDLTGALMAELADARIRTGNPEAFLIPAVVLPRPIAFEYPRYVTDLVQALKDEGIETTSMLTHVGCTILTNKIGGTDDNGSEREDAFLVVRAPADKRFTSAEAPAHFATWRLMPEDTAALSLEGKMSQAFARIADWLDKGKISWAQVYDTRPAAIARRDVGRAVERVSGRRVLVLGCGALGAPIAEYCVRAGAAAVCVVDSGEVHPGILVRQPYDDADIGLPKAERLALRLRQIRPTAEVVGVPGDALFASVLQRPCPRYYDLVIDATANQSVATAIERSKRSHPEHWPDLITVAISQTAHYGVAAVTPRDSCGAGVDLLRRLALETRGRPGQDDVYAEFFPEEQRPFVPEPGCSDPTFVGSATDVTALAAQLLDGALDSMLGTVQVSAAGEAVRFPKERTLCVARLAHGDERQLARTRLALSHDRIVVDRNGAYEIRIDQRALRQMRQFVAEMAAAGVSPASETGGLLLGQFDDACRVAWVSTVTGPPDGSLTSPVLLQLNAPNARTSVEQQTEQSRGLLSFAGFWHTHPGGPAYPSELDRQTMSYLLDQDPGYAPHLVLMIITVPDGGGEAADREPVAWKPDIYAEVLTR
jgi:proteasome lid subunit RPN8/RPN11